MYPILDKLATAVAAWEAAYQCAFFLVALALTSVVVRGLADYAFRTVALLVGLVRSAVTVPVGLFWGWETDGANRSPITVKCTCACDCDPDDDDDDDDEPAGDK